MPFIHNCNKLNALSPSLSCVMGMNIWEKITNNWSRAGLGYHNSDNRLVLGNLKNFQWISIQLNQFCEQKHSVETRKTREIVILNPSLLFFTKFLIWKEFPRPKFIEKSEAWYFFPKKLTEAGRREKSAFLLLKTSPSLTQKFPKNLKIQLKTKRHCFFPTATHISFNYFTRF